MTLSGSPSVSQVPGTCRLGLDNHPAYIFMIVKNCEKNFCKTSTLGDCSFTSLTLLCFCIFFFSFTSQSTQNTTSIKVKVQNRAICTQDYMYLTNSLLAQWKTDNLTTGRKGAVLLLLWNWSLLLFVAIYSLLFFSVSYMGH